MEQCLTHIVALITILSRIADVGTTYLVSPQLKLEANPIAQRFGWKFALATIVVGLVPYWQLSIGIIILTASLLVAATNASKILAARALGEDEYLAFVKKVVVATPPWPGILFLCLPSVCMATLACTMFLFFHDPEHDWGYYFAVGVMAYAVAMLVWYPIWYFRLRRELSS